MILDTETKKWVGQFTPSCRCPLIHANALSSLFHWALSISATKPQINPGWGVLGFRTDAFSV